MNTPNISIGLAFLAGLASFLSPCVLSLVPAYVGYLSGRSISSTNSQVEAKWSTLSHGLAFVFGFSFVFITLGVAASVIGSLLYDIRMWLARIGGVVIVVLGLHMAGIIRISLLEYELRPQTKIDQKRSYFSSALMGIFFSAGWSPCVGPVLGAILTLAMNGGSILGGVKMLSAYSAGLAIPFLLAALGIGWITKVIKKYGKLMHYLEVTMGLILVLVGILLFLGIFERLARFGVFVDFGL